MREKVFKEKFSAYGQFFGVKIEDLEIMMRNDNFLIMNDDFIGVWLFTIVDIIFLMNSLFRYNNIIIIK